MQSQVNPPSAITALWHFRQMSAAIIGAFAFLGLLAALALPPPATATATVLLTDPRSSLQLRNSGTSNNDLNRNTVDQAELMETTPVLELAADRLDPPITVAALRRNVTALASDEANIVRVTAKASSPGRAIDIANAVVDAYRQVRESDGQNRLTAVLDEIDSARDALNPDDAGQAAFLQQVAFLDQEATEARLAAAVYNDGVEAIDPADEGSGGLLSALIRNVALATILGTTVALLVAWRRAEEHARIETPDDLRKQSSVPFLGTSSWDRHRELTTGDLQDEAHETIVGRLRLTFSEGIVMVTGPDAEAVGFLALRIAIGIADERRKCALVDADTYAAHASSWAQRLASLAVPPEEEVLEVASSMRAMGSATRAAVSGGYEPPVGDLGLSVRTVFMGPTKLPVVCLRDETGDVPARLRSPGTQRLIDALRANSEVVVISAPGLPDEPEAISMVTRADGLVLAINAGTPISRLRELEGRVDEMPTPVFGVVLVTGRPRFGVDVRR